MNSISLLLLLFASCCLAAPEQKFLREPPDQTAALGEHVTLPCRVENKQGNLQWTRDDFGLGLNRNLKGFERYRMSGSDEEGDYTLDIDSVTLEDDAAFQCQVGAAPGGVEPIRSRYSFLTVTVPPESPEILGGAVVKTQEDRMVSLECISRGGKPAAEITWLDADNMPISSGIQTAVEKLPDKKRQNTKSVLKLRMLRSHHNTSISCEAQNSAEVSPRSTSVLLKVEFAPWVSLQHTPAQLKEGDSASFQCQASANPDQVKFSWLVDNQEVEGGVDQPHILILPGLTRADNGAIVKCRSSNSIGKSEETTTLDIFYNPEFLKRPQDVSADPGQEIRLECVADGNPPPTYRWFKNGDMATALGFAPNLTLAVSVNTIGRYTCVARVPGYPEIRASSRVYQRGPPRILRTTERPAVQSGALGETLQLTCEAFALPVPDNILWEYNDHPVSSKTEHYQVLTERRRDGLVSTLVIKDSVISDFGSYNCSVRNAYGEDSLIVHLQREESTLLLVILVGVVSGAILVLSVLLVFLHWRRLRAKPCPGPGTRIKQETVVEVSEEEEEEEEEEWGTDTQGTERTDSSNKTGPHSPYSPHPSSDSQLPPNYNGGFSGHLGGPNGHLGGQNGHLGGPNGHLGGPNGHLGGPNGHLPGGLSSHMQGGPNPHMPPIYPSPSQQQSLSPALSTLNVTNPRYAAKYGNPMLREDDPPPLPHLMQHSPYNARHTNTSPRPVFQPLPSTKRHSYQANTLPMNPPAPPQRRDGTVPAHYIQAQDALSESHLATHV